jgi:hypothetical protein
LPRNAGKPLARWAFLPRNETWLNLAATAFAPPRKANSSLHNQRRKRAMLSKYGLPAAALMMAVSAPAFAMKVPPTEPETGSSGGGTAVPEPSSMILFGAGAAALLASRRRKQPQD